MKQKQIKAWAFPYQFRKDVLLSTPFFFKADCENDRQLRAKAGYRPGAIRRCIVVRYEG